MSESRYRDRLGRPVPGRLKTVWRGRESLEEMRVRLHQWRGALAGAVGGATNPQAAGSFSAFVAVPMAEISRLVDEIDRLIAGNMPQVACDCKQQRYCSLCEGKRWLNACDARRISNRGQLSRLSGSLNPPPALQQESAGNGCRTRLSAVENLRSETIRSLWLLAGPPPASSPEPGLETACASTEDSCCTTT